MKHSRHTHLNKIPLVLALSIIAAPVTTGSAREITLSDNGSAAIVLSDSPEEGGMTNLYTVSTFHVLGWMDDQTLAIYTGSFLGYTTADSLKETFPDITLDDLPVYDEADTLPIYSEETDASASTAGAAASGQEKAEEIRKDMAATENVKTFQEELIDLGYMEGEADGYFGATCITATAAFQTTYGLDATGSADPLTQWMAQAVSGTADSQTLTWEVVPQTLEEKFGAVNGQTNVDLTPYLDDKWVFTYDPFEETGLLDPGVLLGTLEQGESDMDQVSIRCSLKLQVTLDYMTDLFTLTPSVEIVYRGAYRPYITGVQLCIGSTATYLTEVTSTSVLDGIQVVETAYAAIDDAALEMLQNTNLTSAVMRIICQDKNYDVAADLSAIWCLDDLPSVTLQNMGSDEYYNTYAY